MDRVRDALLLVAADVDRTRLGTVADVRDRGRRMVRRRRLTTVATACVVTLAAVVAVLLGSGVLRAAPPPVQPRPHPRPSPEVVTVAKGGCGHGLGCPQGQGPFRVVFDSGRGGDQLSAGLRLPTDWSIVEQSGNAVILGTRDVGRPSGMSAGLTMVWPVRPTTGPGDARTTAEQLARLQGAASSVPRPVVIDGHAGWQVLLALPPAGHNQCIDPRSGLYVGEHYVDVYATGAQHCAPLLDVVSADDNGAPMTTPVGTQGGAPLEVTLLDGFGIRTVGGAGVLAIFRWAQDVTAASPGRALLSSLRFGAFATPGCGQGMPPDCPASPTYVASGDPVRTEEGIRAWGSEASFRVPGSWRVLSDDGQGTVVLTDGTGLTGADLLWEPLVPATPAQALADARAWAAHFGGIATLSSTEPVATTVGGRPAWHVDVSVRPGKAPYQDASCGSGSMYYAVALACTAAQSGGTTDAYYLESNVRARLWFVQAGEGRVLMLAVWGRHTHKGQAPQLPKAEATATVLLDSLAFTLD